MKQLREREYNVLVSRSNRCLNQRKELKRLNRTVLEQRALLASKSVARERGMINEIRLKAEVDSLKSVVSGLRAQLAVYRRSQRQSVDMVGS